MELYDIEAEEAAIGSMLNLYKRFEAVDMITVKTELQKMQSFDRAGELAYLVETTDSIPIAANLNKIEEEGIKTGFVDLDYNTNGLHNSDLIVISARPDMGKTTLALNIATNIAKQDISVAMLSLEESKEKYIQRILSMQTMINFHEIRKTILENEEWMRLLETIDEISNMSIFIDDTPALTIEQIRARSIRLKQEKNIGIIVIDYLQLIQGNQKEICFALKELAKELNIPIIVISQLSRKSDERLKKEENPRPIITDVNSDIIEYADVIMLLYKDEYYYPETENKNVSEIIIPINKNGSCGIVELKSDFRYCKFENKEDEEK